MARPILISIIFLIYFSNVIFAQFTPALTVLDKSNLTTTCKTSIASLVDDKVINKCLPMFTIITGIPALLPSSQNDPESKIDVIAQLIRETCSLPKCSSSLVQNTALTLKDNCSLDLLQQNTMATLNLLLFTHYEPIRELSCKRNSLDQFNSFCILETLVNIGKSNIISKRHGIPKTKPKATNSATDPTVSAAGTAVDNNTPSPSPQNDGNPPSEGSDTPTQSGENPPSQSSATPKGGENPPSQGSATPTQGGGNPLSQSNATPTQDGENPPSSATPTQSGENPPSQVSSSQVSSNTPSQVSSNIPSQVSSIPSPQSVDSAPSQSISSFFKTLETLPDSIVCTDCNKAMVSVVMNYLEENPKALNESQIQPTLIMQGTQVLKLKCGSSFLDGTTPKTISTSSRLLHSYFYNFIGISITTILLLL